MAAPAAAPEALLTEQLVQARRVAVAGRLAGVIAHDLNNLLAAILAAGQALHEELGPAGPDCVEDVREILEAGRRARELVRLLACPDRPGPREPDGVDLGEALARIEPLLRRAARDGVRVETHVAQALWPVLGDPAHLEQVLVELVLNALEASPAGGRVEVALENAVAGGRGKVRFLVRDQGGGIPEPALPRLGEPGFSTKGPGRGHGLAAVRRVVAACRGELQVRCAPGAGTTAEVVLPRHVG